MIQPGETAPDFTLPGVADDTIESYTLQSRIDQDQAVLVLFYPFDFSPVCTNELCAIRDAEWFQLTPALDVWAISGDSAYAHRAFADEYDLTFPLLGDTNGRVADAYGVCYDECKGHEGVPKRAVVLIDADQTVRYAWDTDDAFEKPDFFPVKAAIDELAADRDGFGPDGAELSVEYDEGPGQIG